MLRHRLIMVTAFFILAIVNLMIVQKEQLLANGKMVLLELGSRDPRSLMQGDYMVLRYRLADTLHDHLKNAGIKPPCDGYLVLTTDMNHVAQFQRLYNKETVLVHNELLLHYRWHGNNQLKLGAESFFFQEGDADHYAQARYGELRVADSGDSILTGLRNGHFVLLGAGR